MREIKGVIFDLDGVLVTTDKYHYLAWKRLADKLNLKFNEEINHALRGISRTESLNHILSVNDINFSDDEKSELTTLKNNWYVELLEGLNEESLMNGAVETIKKLKRRGIKIGIGSSSANAIKILEKTKLIEYFDVIIDGTMIEKTKPDPEVFLLGAKALNLRPEECAVIEDAEAGLIAAKAGGFITFAVHPAKNIKEKDYYLDELTDLLTYV